MGAQLTWSLWMKPHRDGMPQQGGDEDKTQQVWRCPMDSHLSLARPLRLEGLRPIAGGSLGCGPGATCVKAKSWWPALDQGGLVVPKGET